MRRPEERVPARARSARWFGAAAVALLVLAAANAACLALMAAAPVNEGFGLVNAKWRLLRRLDRPVDCLILGDSSGNQGVDPEVIRQATGERALNLCTIADCLLLNDAWMLDEYLDTFGPPRRVVLVHVVDAWARERIPLSLLAVLPVPRDGAGAPAPCHPLTVFDRIEIQARRAIPLVFQNRSLAYFLLGRWVGAAPVESVIRDDGFNPRSDAERHRVSDDAARHARRASRRPREISPLNRAALEHMIETAGRRGFELIIASSPISDRLAREPAFLDYRNAVNRALADLLRDKPRVRHVLAEQPALPDAVMQSADHVTIDGARQYTRALVDAVVSAP